MAELRLRKNRTDEVRSASAGAGAAIPDAARAGEAMMMYSAFVGSVVEEGFERSGRIADPRARSIFDSLDAVRQSRDGPSIEPPAPPDERT